MHATSRTSQQCGELNGNTAPGGVDDGLALGLLSSCRSTDR